MNHKQIGEVIKGIGLVFWAIAMIISVLIICSAILFGGVLGLLMISVEILNGTGSKMYMMHPKYIRVGIGICTVIALAIAMIPQDPHY